MKSINEKKFIPVLSLTKHSTKRQSSYLFLKKKVSYLSLENVYMTILLLT